MNEKLVKIDKKVKKQLDSARYQHTLGVMYTAASMAMCHGEEVERAMIAGLLHDCAKCIPSDEKIQLCEKNNLSITPVEYDNPGLLHAKLGAFFAKIRYDIEDEGILSAITSHTTGKPGMTTLEKIIYIADFIEPNRKKLPNMDLVRKLAFSDIDLCIFTILRDSLLYLESRNIPLDPMTQKTFEYYETVINARENKLQEESDSHE